MLKIQRFFEVRNFCPNHLGQILSGVLFNVAFVNVTWIKSFIPFYIIDHPREGGRELEPESD